MPKNKIVKSPTLDFIVSSYFLFIFIVLLHSLISQWIFGEDLFINNFYSFLTLHATFFSLFFLINIFIEEIKNYFIQHIFYYFLCGLIGIIIVEWIINGNFHIHYLGQFFFFMFWAGTASLARMFIEKKEWPEVIQHIFIERLVVLYVSIIFIGMLVYFMFQSFVVWKLIIILFYFFLNIIIIKQIFYFKQNIIKINDKNK